MTSIDAENMPDFLRAYGEQSGFPLGFKTNRGTFEAWRQRAHDAFRDAVGPGLDSEATCEIEQDVEIDEGSLRRLRVGFPNGASTTALMLSPDTPQPHPAVLLLHDHGSEFAIGKEKMLPISGDLENDRRGQAWAERLYGGEALGLALARRGYAVVATDALGWGSRQGNGYESQQALAANLMQYGLSWAGIIAAEDVQIARLMTTLPGIDATRIAALGFSFGGFRAWQAAALSPDVRAVVSANWMAKLSGLMRPGNNQLRGQSAFSMLHPSIAGKLDYPDLAGIAAPKPALFIAGADDRHFPLDSVQSAFAELEAIWSAGGPPQNFSASIHKGGHVFEEPARQAAFDFLAKHLI